MPVCQSNCSGLLTVEEIHLDLVTKQDVSLKMKDAFLQTSSYFKKKLFINVKDLKGEVKKGRGSRRVSYEYLYIESK